MSESTINYDDPNPDDISQGNYLKICEEEYLIQSFEIETPTRVRVAGRAWGKEFVRRWEIIVNE